MSPSSLLRRVLPVALVAAACAHETTGVRPGGYPALVRLAPAFAVSGASGAQGATIDSVAVAITNAAGDTLGFLGVSFPPGQDSVVLSIPVVLDSATQTVTASIDVLANGQVVFRQHTQILATAGSSSSGRADSVALESAVWTPSAAGAQVAVPGRVGMTAAYDAGTHDVVAFGGATAAGMVGETWVLSGGQWTRVSGPGPTPRIGQGMVYDAARGRTILFGGALAAGFAGDVWEFNDTTRTWKLDTTTAGPSARGFFAMAYDVARRVVVVFGGHDGTSFLNDTWEYNPAARTWGAVGAPGAPSARAGAAAVYDAALGRTVLFGGFDGSTALADTWTYDGASWAQTAATGPAVRAAAALTYDPAGSRVLLFGGANTHINIDNPDDSTSRYNDLWAFDGASWTQLSTGNAVGSPSKRVGMGAAYDVANTRLVVISGLSALNLESDTWTWSVAAGWTPIATAPLVARAQAGMAYDLRRGVTMMFGGSGADTVTWLYDGTAWRPAAFAGPGARVAPAMAYDSSRGLVVLFGGSAGGTPLADTWVYDGTQWHRRATVAAPPARSGASLTWDARRNVVVLFGGQGASGPLADTWEYRDSAWTQVSTAASPPARSAAAMDFDPVLGGGLVVLFGGAGAGPLADTWTYDGTTWTPKTTAHAPPARSGAVMAFEPPRGKSVLFGGSAAGGKLNDLWRYDGTDWVQLFPGTSPSARSGAAMVWDAGHATLVLFGGNSATGDLADTWLFR